MGGPTRTATDATTVEAQLPAWRLVGSAGSTDLSFALTRAETIVGSLTASDLCLPVRGVSRRHAALRRIDETLWVVDLGSRNGTFVNGLRVQMRSVQAGDELQFGPIALRLERVDGGDAVLAITNDLGPRRPREVDTDWLPGSAEPTSVPLELVRQLVMLLLGDQDRPRVVEAFALLVQHLEVEGGALGEWDGAGEPHVVATWGDLGTRMEAPEVVAFFRQLEARGGVAERFRAALLPTEPRLLCCGLRRPGAALLGMVLRGGPRRDDGPRWGELFLRFLDQSRFRPSTRARPRLGPEAGVLAPPLGIVRGGSPQMQAVYRQVQQVASGTFPVLITGETGVGKEHLVRLVHESSPRREAALVAVNCAAIPAELLEAEMFGIGRGVATGVQERPGKFRQADGGSLFLDEIGELPLPLQAKLLRALEAGEVQPIGCPPVPVDVRVLAATNADLQRRVAGGGFRADLYYRISGCQILVPPLRERPEDIPALIQHFLGRFCVQADKRVSGVTVKALQLLTAYAWPGNVRQLENEIRRMVYACADGQAIDSQLVHGSIRSRLPTADAGLPDGDGDWDLQVRVDRLEHSVILAALERSGGSQRRAAKLLGLSRNGLAAKMRRLGITGG